MNQANKPGFGKGCFGSPTRQTRRDARRKITSLRRSAYRYARSYVGRRVRQSPVLAQEMKDKHRLDAKIQRVAFRRMKALRAKDSGKRTSGTQKV